MPVDDPTATGTDTGGSTDTGDTGEADSSTGDDDGELDPSSVPEPRAGRLTDTQYRYTVLDVLGLELTEEELGALARDIPTGRDYSTTLQPQAFDANYVLGYAEVARSLSARLDLEALMADFAGCDGVDAGCRPTLVEGLGRRMFRRPLTEDELGRYLDLGMAIASIDETDETHVVRGIVQAMLQSSSFLYRTEHEIDGTPGEVRVVDGYELASRLSYFLWQSAPDDELLQFAAGPEGDGQFDPEALPAQVDRMLADVRFDRARELYWGDYTMATRSSFATGDEQLADELRRSLLATLDRISGGGRPLSALLDGDELMMTPAVAELAGATPSGDGLQVYDAADATERTGVVTHPAFLASISTTSFVGRGLFLSERLLCQHIAEPPAGIGEEIENTAQATEDMTPREASEFRLNLEPVCQGCHLQFEPVAYAFERYDTWGRFTLTDEQGRDLFSDGLLPAYGDRPEIAFADARELLLELSQTDAIYACMVENMTQFGTGLPANMLGDFHSSATEAFVSDGLTFEALARAVAGSEQRTLMRVVEP